MPVDVIVDIVIHDPKEYEAYKKLTPATLAAFDGKFVVRGGKTASVEGGWDPERFVILEFSDMKRAREWYDSEQYTKAKEIRWRAAATRMIFAEGVS